MNFRTTACAALALATILSTAGCMSPGAGTPRSTAAGREAAACAPGSARLPLTRLCQSEAAALVLTAAGPAADSADGCTWVVNEAKVLENGALLYRALRCNGRTAKLEFVPGARAAGFDLVASPWGNQAEPHRVALMFDAGGREANAVILEAARRVIEDPAESARCRVRRLGGDVAAPDDALVVDEVPIPPADGIRSACGEFGYDGGAQSFWRVSQNIAWFFSLGNDSAPVDPESFTLIRRDQMGRWVRS